MEYPLAAGSTEDPRIHLEGKGTVFGPLQVENGRRKEKVEGKERVERNGRVEKEW